MFWVVLGIFAGLLDLLAFIALVIGLMTFFTLDGLKYLRWYLIVGGCVGLLVFLPLADYSFNQAVKQVTSID